MRPMINFQVERCGNIYWRDLLKVLCYRIQLGPGVGRDSHDPNGALPFLSTEHGNARKVTDNLANHNSNNRDRKAHQEIIVID